MPIRAALLLAAITACSTSASPETVETVELGQPETGACHPTNYPCTPNNPWSETVCDVICGGQGFDDRGYCLPYTAIEDVWCAYNPGQLFHGDPRRPCDSRGNATWQTRCVPGWLP
jgi:hypothetical protein